MGENLNMNINIKDICGKKTVTRAEGAKINQMLSDKWNSENTIQIDFSNVLVASVSFMDEAFGKLALKHSKEELQNKLKFKNMVKYDKALLNDILYSRFRQKNLGETEGAH